MGVRGLAPVIRRHGIFTPLSGNTVVIDGPSLIYQIMNGCLDRRPSTTGFICQPSYAKLAHAVIGWLEELRKHNVTVRKIYFDGYLPPTKWDVRRERLFYQTQTLEDLLKSHRHGSPRLPQGAYEDLQVDIGLTHVVGAWRPWIPKSPFMVPAILEILQNYRTWSPLVEVVPGEADDFCAEDIRRNGGVILTSDTDLLLTELGPNGSMSFFSDVAFADPANESSGLVTRLYSLHNLNESMNLNDVGGLPRVAFEMTLKEKTDFQDALESARARAEGRREPVEAEEYSAFLEQFSTTKYLPENHPLYKALSRLDPRISEFVIQNMLMDEEGIVPGGDHSNRSRGPATLSMFLPVMIDYRVKKASWSMSTGVRQLAYGIIQTLAAHPSPVVIEYRFSNTRRGLWGRQFRTATPEGTLDQCNLLAGTLEKLATYIEDVNLRWLALAIHQDIVWSANESCHPLSVALIKQAQDTSEHPTNHSWDVIHFTSQVQALYYSLRIAKQGLDVVTLLQPQAPQSMSRLQKCLRTLPPITEWPTVENMLQILAKAGEADLVSVLRQVLGLPEILKQPAKATKITTGPKRGAATRPRKGASKRPVSTYHNSFDILRDVRMD